MRDTAPARPEGTTSHSHSVNSPSPTIQQEQPESHPNQNTTPTSRVRTASIMNTVTSLLPNAFRNSYITDSSDPLEAWGTSSGKCFLSNADKPTLNESRQQAGRADMVAGVDDTSTIKQQLQSILSRTEDSSEATSLVDSEKQEASGSGMNGERYSAPSLADKTNSKENLPGVKIQIFPINESTDKPDQKENNSSKSYSGYAIPSSAIRPVLGNDSQEVTAAMTLSTQEPSLCRNSHRGPVPEDPGLPSTEPSLFLQAADSTGSA